MWRITSNTVKEFTFAQVLVLAAMNIEASRLQSQDDTRFSLGYCPLQDVTQRTQPLEVICATL
jgi:hypothetical protein